MKKKIFSIILVFVFTFSNIVLAKVYNGERVTKKEVAKYFGNNWQQGDFTGGTLWKKIATDSYIERLVAKNKRAKKIHDDALAEKKNTTK